MNTRSFFKTLASGLIVCSAPTIFIPKLIKPVWKCSSLGKTILIDEQTMLWNELYNHKFELAVLAYKNSFRDYLNSGCV